MKSEELFSILADVDENKVVEANISEEIQLVEDVKKAKAPVYRWGLIAACLVLAVGIAVPKFFNQKKEEACCNDLVAMQNSAEALELNNMKSNSNAVENKDPHYSVGEPNFEDYTPTKLTLEQNLKGEDSNGTADGTVKMWWKNKLVMSGRLYNALNNNPDDVYNIIASYHPTTADITSFIYEGKTLSEWAIAAFSEHPTEQDIEGYKYAYYNYLDTVLADAIKKLSDANYECEIVHYFTNYINFKANANQMENLPLDNLEYWEFDLAEDNLKGTEPIVTDANGLKVVN